MLRTEQQKMIKNSIATDFEKQYSFKLAREMLTVIALNLTADTFETDEEYDRCVTEKRYYINRVIRKYFKCFYELYENEFEPSARFYLGKDNKFYDKYYCEVPLKTVKQVLGTNKGNLLKMKINTTLETSNGEVDCLDDWENLSL